MGIRINQHLLARRLQEHGVDLNELKNFLVAQVGLQSEPEAAATVPTVPRRIAQNHPIFVRQPPRVLVQKTAEKIRQQRAELKRKSLLAMMPKTASTPKIGSYDPSWKEKQMTPIRTAYAIGQQLAKVAFEKTALNPAVSEGLILGAAALPGALAAPEGERFGGGFGSVAGGIGGMEGITRLIKKTPALQRKGLHQLAALIGLLGGTYGGYRGGRALEKTLRD